MGPDENVAIMRRAYDARSAIVHGGGTPAPDDLRTPSEETVNLDAFTKHVEDIMRRAVLKILETATPTSLGVNWDALLFPDTVDPGGSKGK